VLAAPAPAWAHEPAPPPPTVTGDARLHSANGAVLLAWDRDPPLVSPGALEHALEYELEEASDASFADAQVRYRGSFPSWFMSGRRDGSYAFRIRSRSWTEAASAGSAQPSAWSEWSATQIVVVEHHDVRLALVLFGFGAAVFLASCLTLLIGSQRTSRRA